MIPINYLAVIVVAIINIVLGFIWYGPLFGKPWMKLMNFSEAHMQEAKAKGMGGSYAIMAIGSVLMSWVLSVFINSAESHYGYFSASFGIHVALYLWIGLVLPLTVGSVIWEKKSWKLWFLNIAYYFVAFCIMGAILAVWH